MPNLIVVLEPKLDDLERVSRAAPVWIVETDLNRRACERLSKISPRSDHREIGAVTCFQASNANDHLSTLNGILQQLETHHGEVEQDAIIFSRNFVLDIIGLPLTEPAKAVLSNFGFQLLI